MPPDWRNVGAQRPMVMLNPSLARTSGILLCCIMQEMDDLLLGNCLVVNQAIGVRADGKISPLISGYRSVKQTQLQKPCLGTKVLFGVCGPPRPAA